MTLTGKAQRLRDFFRGNEEARVKYKLVLSDLDDDLYMEYIAQKFPSQFSPLGVVRRWTEQYEHRNDPRDPALVVPDDELAVMMDRVSAFIGHDDPEDSPARLLLGELATEEQRRAGVVSHTRFLADVEAEHQREADEAREKAEQAEADRVKAAQDKARHAHAATLCGELLDWARENFPLAGAQIEKSAYRMGGDVLSGPKVYYSFYLKGGTSFEFGDSDDLRDKLRVLEYRLTEAAKSPQEKALAELESDYDGYLDDAPEGETFNRLLTEAGEALASGGTLIVLFGPSESAKSSLGALWAAQTVADGGWVIWLGYESDSGELTRRLNILGVSDDDQLRVRWHRLNFPLDEEGRRATHDYDMIRRVRRIRTAGLPVLVVIDSFSAMLSAVNGGTQSASNDDQAVSRMYAVARSLITDDGVTVCMIDHGPGEKPRGSDRKKEEADLMYQLKMHGAISRDGYSAITCRKAPRNSARIASGDTVGYLSAPDGEFRLTTEPPSTNAQRAHAAAREYVLEKMRATLAANPDINDSDLWRAIPNSTKRSEVAADRARLISSVRGE